MSSSILSLGIFKISCGVSASEKSLFEALRVVWSFVLKLKMHEIKTWNGVRFFEIVVTASGTLYKDKDFGAGYKYSVIIEKANVKK